MAPFCHRVATFSCCNSAFLIHLSVKNLQRDDNHKSQRSYPLKAESKISLPKAIT